MLLCEPQRIRFSQHTSDNHTSQLRINVLSSMRRFLLWLQKR